MDRIRIAEKLNALADELRRTPPDAAPLPSEYQDLLRLGAEYALAFAKECLLGYGDGTVDSPIVQEYLPAAYDALAYASHVVECHDTPFWDDMEEARELLRKPSGADRQNAAVLLRKRVEWMEERFFSD